MCDQTTVTDSRDDIFVPKVRDWATLEQSCESVRETGEDEKTNQSPSRYFGSRRAEYAHVEEYNGDFGESQSDWDANLQSEY